MLQFAATVFCATAGSALGSPTEFFPQQRNPSEISMDALAKVELVLSGRCLRLKESLLVKVT